MAQSTRVPLSQLAGVSCVSASILLVELGITRLFSVLTWSHLAFLAVSVALFGLSASGVFLHVAAGWHAPDRLLRQLWRYAIAFSLLTLVMGVIFLRANVMPWFTSKSSGALIGAYLLAAAPFFAGGACLTLAVSRLHGDIHRVYGADLAGAAAGCLLVIPALNLFGGAGPLLGAAGLGAVAAVLFTGRESLPRRVIAALVALGCAFALVAKSLNPAFLDVRYLKGEVSKKVLFTQWNSHSRIAVYPEPQGDWGLSDTYSGPHPLTLAMNIDASAATPILLVRDPSELEYLRSELTAFAYRLLPPRAETLVIGPGGGRDLWTGLIHGASRITGVEINSIIVNEVMRDRFRKRSGDVYFRPGVEVFVDDGRNFVARSRDHYDLIQASLVDTWAATAAGAFALSENNLYTVEAFVDYLEHLKPAGVLSVSRWSDDAIRLLSLARGAGERLGLGTMADRIVVVRQRGMNLSSFVIKRSPMSRGEVERLRADAEKLNFEVQYAPPVDGLQTSTDQSEFARLLNARDPETYYRHAKWDVSPPTDDRPFFFQPVKREAIPGVLKSALFSGQTDGMSVLARLLYISAFLVALFIIVPLLWSVRRPGQLRQLPLDRLAYFACLGVGFMLIEIGLMQRFVLFLGHPVYALTVILFTLLLGGGVGSIVSRRLFAASHRPLLMILPLVALTVVAYAFLLPPLFHHWLGFPRPVRIVLSVGLLLPLGMLLGIPLPAGIGLLGRRRAELLAWAWAINGGTSVLGSILAVFVAVLYGFRVVALLGAAAYVVALLLGVRLTAGVAQAETTAPT